MKNKVHWINSLAIFELSKSENISLFPFSFRNRKRPNTTYADTSHACERCEWHQMLPESSAWLYKQLANNMWRLQRQRERCRYNVRLEIKWKCLASHHKAGNQMKTQPAASWIIPAAESRSFSVVHRLTSSSSSVKRARKKILFFQAVIVQRTRLLWIEVPS